MGAITVRKPSVLKPFAEVIIAAIGGKPGRNVKNLLYLLRESAIVLRGRTRVNGWVSKAIKPYLR